jgi:hypothetical protein
MKRGIWILPLILLAGAAAAEIQIFNPPDKLRTFDEVVMLQGKVVPPAEIRIGTVRFQPQTDGTFTCGLVLKPGKNLVVVARGTEEAKLRVLRMVTFPDIETTEDNSPHWARGQITYLASLGIIEGYPDGNFYPGNPVTRGEFATWLAKVKKLAVPALTRDVFFDVPKEHWRAPYIKAVADAGLMAPSAAGGTFGLDDPVLRGEAADLAVRTEGQGSADKISTLFKNVPSREAITRAEAATLLSFFGAAQESIHDLSDFDKGFTADKYCGLNVAPAIVSFTATPEEISVNQAASLKLRAVVASRESFSPVSKAKVNLVSIGGASDAEMFDDGTHGDEAAGDGTYSLNLSFHPKSTGERRLEVTVTDRLGWEGKASTSILIVE